MVQLTSQMYLGGKVTGRKNTLLYLSGNSLYEIHRTLNDNGNKYKDTILDGYFSR